MNYFIEGIQGSGKSTLLRKMKEQLSNYHAFYEGEYSPVELAWCAYVSKDKYQEILNKYNSIRNEIEDKSYNEDNYVVICYTNIITDISGFHRDMEQYEIYNNRVSYDEFKRIVLERFNKWNGTNMIFECSLFQNIVEDLMLFRRLSDEEIIEFYKEIASVIEHKDINILYLKSDDIDANIDVIRKERVDEHGNEMWFPLMCGYFNNSPYALERGAHGKDELIKHLKRRQELELRICREVFGDVTTILEAKKS
jgi:hypothetical protein